MSARACWICAAILLALTTAAYANRDGDVIKIYVTGRDASWLIAEFNSYMAPHDIKLEVVESSRDADVTLSYREEDLRPDADGRARVAAGHISMSSTAAPRNLLLILIHELLHCAGEGHETRPGSVMNANTGSYDWALRDDQIRDLRRLPGITYPERFIAQIRTIF